MAENFGPRGFIMSCVSLVSVHPAGVGRRDFGWRCEWTDEGRYGAERGVAANWSTLSRLLSQRCLCDLSALPGGA